ncbi:hypothetical protein FOZ61_001109 [Perkinsus olseni]|uniref:Transmembrane protein 184C n=2 Tax=Perkinsus olseni TaxID=32597 RepID=A0A7J6KS12_PEROL|nr:hypothetical protein FOZ61_001109 [Perkinsus olseni]
MNMEEKYNTLLHHNCSNHNNSDHHPTIINKEMINNAIIRVDYSTFVVVIIISLMIIIIRDKSSYYYLYMMWLISLLFATSSIIISMLAIRDHLRNFSKPIIQRKIVGILLMVPVYATTSWLSLLFVNHSMYLDMLRDCYESFVIYTFFSLTYSYITQLDDHNNTLDHDKIIRVLEDKAFVRHIPPVSCFINPIHRTILLVTPPQQEQGAVSSSSAWWRERSMDSSQYHNYDDVITLDALDLSSTSTSIRDTTSSSSAAARSPSLLLSNHHHNNNNYMNTTPNHDNIDRDLLLSSHTQGGSSSSTLYSSNSRGARTIEGYDDRRRDDYGMGWYGDIDDNNMTIGDSTSLWHPRSPKDFLISCKTFVLQFLLVKPLTTILAFILHNIGLYEEGDFSPLNGYLYICICVNISISLSLYWLVMFYMATKRALEAYNPVPKFLCIKAVLFASFWQSVILNIMIELGLLADIPSLRYNTVDVQDVVSDISQVSFIPRPAPAGGGGGSMITRVTTQLKQLKRPTALLLPHTHLRKNRRRPRPRRDEAVEVHDGRKEGVHDMRDDNAAVSDGIITVIQDDDENGQQSLNKDGDNNNNNDDEDDED